MKKRTIWFRITVQFLLGVVIDYLNLFIDQVTNTCRTGGAGSERLIGSRFNHGFLYSKNRRLSLRQSFEGVILSSPTGAGKTSRLLIKNICLLKHCSLIINDPQHEIRPLVSGYLTKHFSNQVVLNFSDSSISAGYNPFSFIRTESDAHKLASMLISSTLAKGGGDIFWTLSSINLTQVLIRILLYQPQQFHNLANLIRLLYYFSVEGEKVDKWVIQTKDEKLLIDYKTILNIPDKTRDNVVASVKSALQLFDNPQIAKTTAYNSVDFSKLRKMPSVIFLQNKLSDAKYLSILNSIFFEQFYGYVLDTPLQRNDLPIFVILEECATSLNIPVLPQATSTCRKVKVGNFLAVQSHLQLKALYNEQAEEIKSSCRTKIYLSGQTAIEELKEIELLSGKCLQKDERGIEQYKPLVPADSVRTMPTNRTIIISSNRKLIRGRTSPYYHSLTMRHYTNLPPKKLIRVLPDGPIPML